MPIQKIEIEKDKVIQILKDGICEIAFVKVNGENRMMKCTLNSELMNIQEESKGDTSRKKTENPEVQAVYDLESKGWRSFRWDSLVSFERVEQV